MKKTLVSLAGVMALGAGSAHAAEVYALDGVTVELTGEVGVQYIKSQSQSEAAELNVDSATFGFAMSYEMTEELMISSGFGVDANNPGDEDRVTGGDAYISLTMSQVHEVSFGAQSTVFDQAGIGDDYEFGFLASVEELESEADQVVKYTYNGQEMFTFAVAYAEFKNSTETDTGPDDDDYHTDSDFEVDGRLGINVEDLNLALYLAHGEQNDLETNAYVLEANYRIGDITFAGSYGASSADKDDEDIDMYGVTATYFDGGRWKYGAGWAATDNSTADDTVNTVYANATFMFTDEVNAYAEVGSTDEDDADTGYVIGMNANF